MTVPLQRQAATVGDTIWVTRTVELPPGRTLRAAEWEATDPVELLGPARVTLREGAAEVAYPVSVWRTGFHTVEVPGPLLLAADGGVDSLGSRTVTLEIASVLPRAATDTSLRPQPRAEFVPQPVTTPVPVVILVLLAIALLAPLHWWWRRRGRPRPRPTLPTAPADPPLERWADAGESRAVAAAASARLRGVIAAGMPPAHTGLDTAELLRAVAGRADWPLAELGDLLQALDEARFGHTAFPDALGLARWADELAPRLEPEAA
jgi:hypothetical protein